MDPRLEQLWRKQALETEVLFAKFIRDNPELQVDVMDAYWPDDKEAEYKALTSQLDAAHEAECEALITIIESEM